MLMGMLDPKRRMIATIIERKTKGGFDRPFSQMMAEGNRQAVDAMSEGNEVADVMEMCAEQLIYSVKNDDKTGVVNAFKKMFILLEMTDDEGEDESYG